MFFFIQLFIQQFFSVPDKLMALFWVRHKSQGSSGHSSTFKSHHIGTSQVDQWLRIHLPMQGTWVSIPGPQEDPTCFRATKLVCHNPWAVDNTRPGARALQQEELPQGEPCTRRGGASPAHHSQGKPAQHQRPSTAKNINKWINIFLSCHIKVEGRRVGGSKSIP